jgi:hypothetical protein
MPRETEPSARARGMQWIIEIVLLRHQAIDPVIRIIADGDSAGRFLGEIDMTDQGELRKAQGLRGLGDKLPQIILVTDLVRKIEEVCEFGANEHDYTFPKEVQGRGAHVFSVDVVPD